MFERTSILSRHAVIRNRLKLRRSCLLPFIHLRSRSAFSLCEGAIPCKRLPVLAKSMRQPAIAMTDNNNIFGGLEFSKACFAEGIQPIIGSIVTLFTPSGNFDPDQKDELVLLCQNEAGYRNLSWLVSKGHLDSPEPGVPMVSIEALQGHSDGLIALWGGRQSSLDVSLNGKDLSEIAIKNLSIFKKLFENRLYVEIQRCGEPGDSLRETLAKKVAMESSLPIVATNDVYFAHQKDHLAQDVLQCIGTGRYELEDDRPKLSNQHYLKSSSEMAELFSDLPEAIEATVEIAQRCAYRVWFQDPILPVFPLEADRSADDELRRRAFLGFEDRFRGVLDRLGEEEASIQKSKYLERLEYELSVIKGMGFSGYFLIVSDFMVWTKDQGIPIGVRGSGATSIVAWCMYITQLDPVRFDLVFERFLNPERVSLPDFDIDFCQDRRSEVIQYVQTKYGKDCVAQIITFGKLQAKAAVRDVGRVIGTPYPLVERISKYVGDAKNLTVAREQEPDLASLLQRDDQARRCYDIAKSVEGLYRHASTHAAGVIIADRPVVEILPLYKDPNAEMPVTQFHFKDAESVGLVKFDFLGLRTLTIIAGAVDMVKERTGETIKIDELTFDDAPVYEMLQTGDTTGVFQLESAGMKDLLKRLKPTAIEQLIALISLYRPGPMDSIPSYIARANDDEVVEYDHPSLTGVLEETYGIITYQEQVMQIARDLGGYSLGEADLLRRAMGKKIVSEMQKHKAKFCSGAAERGVSEPIANTIFEKCAKFAGYGFNKGHAAAYAQVSYQTAHLKYHHKIEFYASCMTVDSDSVDRLYTYVKELRGLDIPVIGPDINKSSSKFTIIDTPKPSICYSLSALKGVGAGIIDAIVHEREKNGPFKSVEDVFVRCGGINAPASVWSKLVDAGAFDSLYGDRRAIRKSLKKLVVTGTEISSRRSSNQSGLFGNEEDVPLILPPNRGSTINQCDLDCELEAFGFFFSGHPVELLHPFIDADRTSLIADANAKAVGKKVIECLCNIGAVQKRRSAKTGNPYAFVQLSDQSGDLEVLAFANILDSYADLLVPKQNVLAQIEIDFSEERERYSLIGLRPVTSAFKELSSLDLRLPKAKDINLEVQDLAEIISTLDLGHTPLLLRMKLDDGRKVTLSLGRPIRVDDQAVSSLADFIDYGSEREDHKDFHKTGMHVLHH